MKFCIAGRCDGASSTSAASSGMASESVCNRKSTGIGSAARSVADNARPAGIARLVSGSRSISIVSAGFIVAMMLAPCGVTAAAVGSSVIWKMLVAPSKIEAWPSTWKVKTAARRERADPHGRFRLLRNAHHQIDGLRAIDGGADHEGRALACRKRRRKRVHRAHVGAELAADVAGVYRLGLMGPVVDRHRHESWPARRLHRHVIGARDRRRDVLGARRLDRKLDVGSRKFGRTLGIKKWLQRQDAARLLARRDYQRRLVAMGGVDIAEPIADAGGGMQIDKG